MSPTLNLFADAVQAIYDAAAEPSIWPRALQAMADVFGDSGTVLLWRRDDGSYGTIVSPSLAAAQEDFEKTWWRHDIRSARLLEQAYLKSQEVFTDRHLVTEEEIENHPIYTEFLIPHGLGWCAGAAISPDPPIDVWISIQRPKAKAPYSDEDT